MRRPSERQGKSEVADNIPGLDGGAGIALHHILAVRPGDVIMTNGESQYRSENGVSLIEIRLSSMQQLFNSLDPAPFHEKDLDPEAEAYIAESAREFPISTPLKLVLYVPQKDMTAAEDARVEEAIHHYFGYRLWLERAALRRELSYGRTTLVIGLAFLFACIALRQLVLSTGQGTVYQIMAEGLLISGWVAMWRPIQAFLYDWWPIRRNCRLYEKLARLPVDLRPRQD